MNHCEYCESKLSDIATGTCPKCGGPIGLGEHDYSVCPYCKHKLLALASINCNYCGKGLPPELVQVRQALAKTLAEQTNHSHQNNSLFSDGSGDSHSLLNSLGDIIRVLDR